MRGRSFAALNMNATEAKKEEVKARLTPVAYIEFTLASKAAENK
jgi:hypothetical protein